MLLQQADNFLHSGTGAFEPTLGEQSPNVRTKGATLALQQQHTEGNSNWLDNHASIALTHEARIVLDLIPYVYDRPGRVERILDIERKSKSVVLNAPFMEGQKGGRPQALPPEAIGAMPPDQVKRYDLKKGRYGVVVSIGKAYKTLAQEGADELGQLFQAAPELFGLLGDIYLKFRDFPGHDLAAERMKRMLPPQARDMDEQNAQSAQQEAAVLKAQLSELTGKLQEAGEIIKTDQVKVQGQLEKAQIDAQAMLRRAEIDAQTKLQLEEAQADKEIALQVMKNAATISVAHIAAASKGAALDAHAAEEREALGHEAAMRSADAGHEERMTAAGREHEAALEGANRVYDAEQSEADREIARAEALERRRMSEESDAD